MIAQRLPANASCCRDVVDPGHGFRHGRFGLLEGHDRQLEVTRGQSHDIRQDLASAQRLRETVVREVEDSSAVAARPQRGSSRGDPAREADERGEIDDHEDPRRPQDALRGERLELERLPLSIGGLPGAGHEKRQDDRGDPGRAAEEARAQDHDAEGCIETGGSRVPVPPPSGDEVVVRVRSETPERGGDASSDLPPDAGLRCERRPRSAFDEASNEDQVLSRAKRREATGTSECVSPHEARSE